MPLTANDAAIKFLLKYVERTGDTPTHQQAKDLLFYFENQPPDQQPEQQPATAAIPSIVLALPIPDESPSAAAPEDLHSSSAFDSFQVLASQDRDRDI